MITQTPFKIQKLLCINVFRLASNTQLLPIEFLRFDVTYTGMVIELFGNFSRRVSTGTIAKMGNFSGELFDVHSFKHRLFTSHIAPSKYNPVM
jgi:hypothetical protein